MKLRNIKGAIFDFDGTLADSLHVWSDIDYNFMNKRGLKVPDDYYKAVAPMNLYQAAVYTIELLKLNETPEQVMEEWYDMARDEYANNVLLKPQAKEFVELLRENGVKTALATAGDSEFFIPALKNNGAEGLFDAYALTSEVEREKGSPDVYDLAAERLGVPPEECAVFEDIAAGIRGAKAGGYIAVGVYDVRSAHDEQEIKTAADLYVRDFSELISIFR